MIFCSNTRKMVKNDACQRDPRETYNKYWALDQNEIIALDTLRHERMDKILD